MARRPRDTRTPDRAATEHQHLELGVPAVLLLGARIGEEIGGLDRLVASAGRSAFWVGVAVLLLVLGIGWWIKRRKRMVEAIPRAEATPPSPLDTEPKA